MINMPLSAILGSLFFMALFPVTATKVEAATIQSTECKRLYATYKKKPNHRAFALSSSGRACGWAADFSSASQANSRALRECRKSADVAETCRIYSNTKSEARSRQQTKEAREALAKRKSIQAALNTLGFDAGDVDGQFGPQTKKAISAFQKSIRAKQTGSLSQIQERILFDKIKPAPDPIPVFASPSADCLAELAKYLTSIHSRSFAMSPDGKSCGRTSNRPSTENADKIAISLCSWKEGKTCAVFANSENNARALKLKPRLGKAAPKEADPKEDAIDYITIYRWQRALNALGFHMGKPNGLPGPATTKAIAAFQQSINAAPTGILTPSQAARLLKKHQDALASKHPKPAPSMTLEDTRKAFQTLDCDKFSKARKEHQEGRSVAQCETFLEAFERDDCTAMRDLSAKTPEWEPKVMSCFRKREWQARNDHYMAAEAAGDCLALERIGPALGKPNAGESCALERAIALLDCDALPALAAKSGRIVDVDTCLFYKAMTLTSDQGIYLKAVKFDSSGKLAEAGALYSQVLEVFPESELALRASERLITLNDLARANGTHAEFAGAIDQLIIDASRAVAKSKTIGPALPERDFIPGQTTFICRDGHDAISAMVVHPVSSGKVSLRPQADFWLGDIWDPTAPPTDYRRGQDYPFSPDIIRGTKADCP